jgi:hypothetical protein
MPWRWAIEPGDRGAQDGGIGQVLAGDPQSMAFAKLATFELLDELHRAYGPAAPRSYVDDMAMMLVELTQSALLGTLQFGMGAVAGAVLSLLHDGTSLPMSLTIGMAGAAALAARLLLGRRGAAPTV